VAGRLQGKIVLVTGAAGAVGHALTAAIVREGGRPVATDLTAGPGIDHALDVTSEADWQRVVAEVERSRSRLDGLVNGAGIVVLGSIEDTDLVTFRRVVAVNLDGTFLGCKYSLPLLKARGGSIVNVSSVSDSSAGIILPPTTPPKEACGC
jgi:NAD(P)-dependent dehydrogenase (short-subunit alcohol dehydrogenase family)